MSSILRSFVPQECPAFRIVNEIETKELYKDFALVATSLFRTGARFGDLFDQAKSGSNMLFTQISDYLVKKRRINCLISLFNPRKSKIFYLS
jgi:hypothetical protein